MCVYIYMHFFMTRLKMASKSRNMSLYILKGKISKVELDYIYLLYLINLLHRPS